MSENINELDVLFVEDTVEDAELSVHSLVREGFVINWERVDNERDLRKQLSTWDPDVILSDYSMPGFNGRAALQICQELTPEVPFIFVSGTIDEEFAIESLRNGAADYVLKDNLRRLGTSVNRAVIDAIRRQTAQEVEKERLRLIAITEATSDMVVISNPDGLLTYINPGARNMLGLAGDIALLTITRFITQEQWTSICLAMPGHGTADGIWQGDLNLYSDTGVQIPVSLVVIAHHEQTEQPQYYSFIARLAR